MKFKKENKDIHWCPGCGNYGILDILNEVLEDLNLNPSNTVMISGIGQAGKTPHFINLNCIHSLHGRALPIATGVKAANKNLTVLAEGGDGDMYGEGGNHFMHAIRRNPNITNIVHNNMVYGLTKGQASPTSPEGFQSKVQVSGVFEKPFNPLAVAISLDASFVARAFVGNKEHTKKILKDAIKHKGYALVDLFQPCVVFNKINTYKWFEENTYYLENHNPNDKIEAIKAAFDNSKLGLGIFYKNKDKPVFEDKCDGYFNYETPLYERKPDKEKLEKLLKSKA
ncbi:MAG: 2-oxoacid ferredoxin oxidoreductase [Candidatus Mcinerneyibacterium aminivorans]|uniref:2-oxoacid ferredoxin oxidoreductase n=1 Tax=Candidatus Mcinerneyibacterium aminivorans TaxID=2703815 RepID=A0A5D0MJ50_9BACT|nr:MAG: 2-oxoacid ferredoxin oxidoreductase [Candidatus Mcinerneyibacterium aminivorans]